MEYYYAQLDENGICAGVSQLSGPVEAENMIPLEEYCVELLGKRYNSGDWFDVPAREVHAAPPVTLDEIAENQLIIMEALADIYEGGMRNG